jgi:hypothetical protein
VAIRLFGVRHNVAITQNRCENVPAAFENVKIPIDYNHIRKGERNMKKLGFGCMRLPMVGGPEGQVDQTQFNQMVDQYMAAGFRYFDTAHVYLGGKSETALREGLVKRYPRERFLLTDKLSGSCFQSESDILPLFETQLEALGTDYLDYYLMHALSAEVYEKFTACNAFSVAQDLKAQGRIRHLGISFHDTPEVLEKILREHPEIEVVQIQLNYLDYDDPSVQSGGVYRVCRKFGKPILVMEPVKGGGLASLPEEALTLLRQCGDGSPASFAIRYAASFPGVFMVLSGMSDPEQMSDNLGYMSDFQPLSPKEQDTLIKVREIIKKQDLIPCTACRYCTAGCPKHIAIPDLFACMNNQKKYQDWSSTFYYGVHTKDRGRAGDCIRCRKCERICPQHLPITDLLQQVSQVFDQD